MEMLPEPAQPIARTRTFGGNRAFHNWANDFSHIQDPNLRRRLALSEIDKVPFGLYHVRAVVVAGIGFFLDSYDIFAINLITTLLGVVFWQGSPEDAGNGYGGNYGSLPTPVSQAFKASTSAGIVIGQVLLGWLADVFGRRRMYGVELGIIVVSTLGCTLAAPSQSMSFTGLMTFWRIMMGVGIGGDHPLSSVITAEFSPTRWRGAMMAAVFSMQGLGQLSAAVVALIVTVAFKDAYHNAPNVTQCDYMCQTAADRSWRIIVGVGALPACFALYYRITIPETPRYTFEVAKDVEKAGADIKAYMASKSEGEIDEIQQARMKKVASPSLNIPSASWPDLFSYFRQWKNAKVLIGTTMSWFFLDLAFYGLGLNNTIVLHAIGYASGETLYHQLFNNAIGTIILAVAGSLPGYWTAIFTIDTLGRKPLQIFGFIFLTIIFCILGFFYRHLHQGAMLALYVIAQFFFNWGPNTTTFVLPGECFPTRYRSSGHGLSAAMGKVGAIVAQVISIPLLNKDSPADCVGSACSPWIDRLMQIFALFMFCGTLFSLLIPETKGISLEELAGEPPTSYNAGQNRSGVAPPKRRWRNPFSGGQPAGFNYRAAKGGNARNGRVGIMTSPEFAAQQAHASKREGRRWKRKRGGSKDGAGYEMSSTSSTMGIVSSAVTTAREDGDVSGAHGGLLPGWGAGWGRVDRGGHPTPIENIKLTDVGSLLK
ncbi:major facilitator superfamily domain-containing protein [Pseudomassariella vexata]|uniref:Major facilitator superfamily domain-containing protein n=1 Tax=Pseudomassariella vexata TaxID=1141098 RepID=A0A1Y2E107_9PEZI|nr:major facilitator superfamily domain-containing protein [Pseudomassariella vexata]ORY65222.1 major facilitator superfamily domain-containing protein [Pseudomassariella vexata]